MSRSRSAVASAAVAIAAAATGCGFGPGDSSEGEATLTVTRDYGAEHLLDVSEQDPAATETVIRFLDRETEITTRYSGGFVQSIDGISGAVEGGRSNDWFFYVNGIEADRGGADVGVAGGDRIWWDYRDWTDAMRVPAVVGSWPEPFAQASTPQDERQDVDVQCLGVGNACRSVVDALDAEGVDRSEFAAIGHRILVGPWALVRDDPVAAQLDDGPSSSGVFARFEQKGARWELIALDERADEADRLAAGAGLVAALRAGEDPPTWIVTGTDGPGVEAAARLLGDGLADRYAVAADGSGAAIGLPEAAR
jgi:hypothetical protein